MAKKKLKAEIQAELDALEYQYTTLTNEHLELRGSFADERSYAEGLKKRNVTLNDELDSVRMKVKLFRNLLKDEQEHNRTLAAKIDSFHEGMDEFQEEVEGQFQVLKTAVSNAETMILGK